MNMHLVDWLIVAALVVVSLIAALSTARYTRSVSAFLAANRCGRRHLIAMALAMAGIDVITLIYWFQMYYEAGFPACWWNSLSEPALIVIALSGWIAYRYRQTRAMTLAQFFEMRYSRSFRVFAGLVAFIAGIINFGIYPAVGSRFFVAICGLPDSFNVLGVTCSTYIVIMSLLLSIALLFTFLGGQIAIMVTDFIQGVFANTVFVILIVFLLCFVFRWDQIEQVLLQAPKDASLIQPMHMSRQNEFDMGYFLIAVFVIFYTFNAWQGTAGYNCCAANAHEAKMAGVLYGWRFRVMLTVTVVVPIAVMTLMHHPDFAEQAAALQSRLDAVAAPTAEQQRVIQSEVRFPYALALLLPRGMLGLFVAAALAAFISTHNAYMHSWGSIFLQDVVLPFRRKPISTRTHLWLLRLSILGVAAFIFFFSMIIKPTQYIAMFFAITGAVFVGGAGAAIIGGLYWKRGSTQGAWAAMISGMVLSVGSIILQQIDVAALESFAKSTPIVGPAALYFRTHFTGQEQTFMAMLIAVGMYVLVSLFGPKHVADLDKLLHRKQNGADHIGALDKPLRKSWLERLGIDPEFTRGDRWTAYISVGWPLLWSILLVVVTIWNLIADVPDSWWLRFWRIWIWVFTAGAAGITIWFTIGGFMDLRFLYRHLREYKDDPSDDGSVNANHGSTKDPT